MKRYLLTLFIIEYLLGQVNYNHPELNWYTFKTKHFQIHYHDETELTAREAAKVAEEIYPHIVGFYDFTPKEKTHIVLIDTDDYSNGAAYYYDNKIIIWASPLDFELRGSHRWLQNVITHEFAHIVSLQKAMKVGTRIPGAYLQLMQYEEEKRPDVLYGYPNLMISYPLPGTTVPPWLAEGVAQFMYENADWDIWDSHRDMILRDRVINDNLLSFTEMNTFGKKGIGNESIYNSGFALSTYIANEYGSNVLSHLMEELSSPFNFSINKSIKNVIGISSDELYDNFKSFLDAKYNSLIDPIEVLLEKGNTLGNDGTTNIHPKWHPNDNSYLYLSNKANDFFGQTDLYFHNLDTGENKMLKSSVVSPPSWHSNGKVIYYSKRAKFPNKNGSRFYDIYSYNLEDQQEVRITNDKRAFNPVYIEQDSAIAYLATYDGGQNVFLLHLKSMETEKLTDYQDRPMISFLTYESKKRCLYFDITTNHFRDIYKYGIENKSISPILTDQTFDERNISFGNSGFTVHSQDKNGIFNLFLTNPMDSTSGYITNVTGGAFMPDISSKGKVLFSLYDNGAYRISLLDKIIYIEEDFVGYQKDYSNQHSTLRPPIKQYDTTAGETYIDQFPNMYIMPKVMYDYGTVKPGFYFSSDEIINRLSLFGGASINKESDVDLFFMFDFKRFYPTLFFETFYLTRNINDKSTYQGAYAINDNIKFRLVQFRSGIKYPIFGSSLEFSLARQWYRAFIKEQIYTNEHGILNAGAAYDYYRGWILNGSWSMDMRKKTLHRSINPTGGFSLHSSIDFEMNDFIEGLDLSNSGTLLEKFQSNNLSRVQLGGTYHLEIPWLKDMAVSLGSKIGWINYNNVDSFFHFYLGGMSGIRGYPYYSIQGTKSFLIDFTLRMPIFMEEHYKFNWMIFQNSTIALITQVGDAWKDEFSMKKSFGIQWRINGFSFYNFPTSIELEYHQPLNKFERLINDQQILYGENGRAYAKILFDF